MLVPPCACPTIFRHGEQTATIVFWAKSLVVIRNAPHRHLRFVRRVPKSINFLPSRAWGEVTFLATHARFKEHFGRFLGFFPSGACTPRGILFGNLFRPTVSVSGDFRKRPAARVDSFFFFRISIDVFKSQSEKPPCAQAITAKHTRMIKKMLRDPSVFTRDRRPRSFFGGPGGARGNREWCLRHDSGDFAMKAQG